jgi:phage terminase large subunit
MPDIDLPYNHWWPRDHQMALWQYLQAGGKRAIAVWHRRAGKDEVCLHHTAVSALKRPGNYAHCLPIYAQGRKAIWTAINPHSGKRRIDEAFPEEIRSNTNDQEMFIRFVNGSTWSVIGSDNYDTSLVGTSTAGIVFSEHALGNPSAWAYTRPTLEENNGWAIFITTPRGRNHAFDMFNHAKTAPGWFAELLTVDDTGALTPQQLHETKRELVALYGEDAGGAQFRQELYCDFQAAILGAFYALEMATVREEGRIIAVDAPHDVYVHRAWDLGVTDDQSIWWFCVVGGQVFLLDHYAASGVGVEHYLAEIEKRERAYGWKRGVDFVPHDAKVKEWGTGKTRVETMQSLGLKPHLVPWMTLEDGRNAVRRMLPLCIFHPRCEATGIAALEQYRREWDADKKAYRESHVHDWTSHPADAFRYLAASWRYAPAKPIPEPEVRGIIIPPPPEFRGGIRL